MRTIYERDIYLFLSLYRFFAYGLAVVLLQAVPSGATEPGLPTYLLLALMGIYTLLKVLGPLRWWQQDPMTYIVLGADLLVSLLALLLTGGLTSGFLLYSFVPVMSAALLFEERLAHLAAAVSSLTVAVAHLLLSRWSEDFLWIMEGNILLWLLFYMMASFLATASVFRTNLNIRQRIQRGAILEERRRMRREIHDGVAQALSYLSLRAETVRKMVAEGRAPQALTALEDVRKAVDETYRAVRESLDQLTVEVGAVPLAAALQEYLRQFEESNGIRTNLEVAPALPGLSPVAEVQALRIVQEALSNVRKHAHATQVRVALRSAPRGMEVSVKDNGQGFAPGQQPSPNGASHHGLTVMRERAEGLGGSLDVQAAPGEGTEVRVFLPAGRGGGVLWRG